jgi:hypothetical protein
MDVIDLLKLAGQFGPMGLMVAYLVWRDTRDDRLRCSENETRDKLAGALAVLSDIIRTRGHV